MTARLTITGDAFYLSSNGKVAGDGHFLDAQAASFLLLEETPTAGRHRFRAARACRGCGDAAVGVRSEALGQPAAGDQSLTLQLSRRLASRQATSSPRPAATSSPLSQPLIPVRLSLPSNEAPKLRVHPLENEGAHGPPEELCTGADVTGDRGPDYSSITVAPCA